MASNLRSNTGGSVVGFAIVFVSFALRLLIPAPYWVWLVLGIAGVLLALKDGIGGLDVITLVLAVIMIVGPLLRGEYYKAIGMPTPPSVYENLGSVDDFATGFTHLRQDVWIVKTGNLIDAIRSDPSCPLRADGDRLLDCRNAVYAVQGDPTDHLQSGRPPRNLQLLCTWVYPPAGDVYVYFGPPASHGCPGMGPETDR